MDIRRPCELGGGPAGSCLYTGTDGTGNGRFFSDLTSGQYWSPADDCLGLL